MIPVRPDILWIVTTQWRAQATGYANDPNARTPHLDSLAAESINYAQAVTPHPFGPFARAAMLTGLPSPDNGVSDYFDPLPAGARTIADELRANGYLTAFFGKWHLYERDRRADRVGPAHAQIVVPPERRGGFEFWEGFESGFLLNDPWLHGTRLTQPAQFAGYQSDVVCDRAAAWIKESGKQTAGTRPLFCVVSLEPPHPPYDAPVPTDGATRDPRAIVLPQNVPRGGDIEAVSRRELAGYYAHVEATDRAVGRFLEAVRRDNRVIVFTSVHGDMHGSHGVFRKGWPYEESVRIPLLVRPPGAARSGGGIVSPALVSLVDLPEMTRRWAAGGPVAPAAGAAVQKISMPSVVPFPRQCDRAWRGVRTRTRKLVLAEDGLTWLCFDLERDPGEQFNLRDDPAWAVEAEMLRRVVEAS
jgi:arylsulfatase A-like enzyme